MRAMLSKAITRRGSDMEKTMDNWEIPVNSERFHGCSSCRKIFFGLGAFDKHRVGSHSGGTRRCESPEAVGLKLNGDGLWSVGREFGGER